MTTRSSPEPHNTGAARAPASAARDAGAANFEPLSPLSFLFRAAEAFPERIAVVQGARRTSYRQLLERCQRLAAALRAAGVGHGDVVAILAPNVQAVIEANFAVPLAGGILNALNVRLDAGALGAILEHCRAKVLLVDQDFVPLAAKALATLATAPLVIDIPDSEAPPAAPIGRIAYEALLAGATGWAAMTGLPADEADSIALNYTSGTTGAPKGALMHHRGAYLAALGNCIAVGLTPASVYLWTLPMFHCNGWTFVWAVAAVGGTQVCLRRIDVAQIYALLAHERVTHLCGAPIVVNLLAHAPAAERQPLPHPVIMATGGAAPPSAVIRAIEAHGFRIVHLYGLTEVYGPATHCVEPPEWAALPTADRARLVARQGVRGVTVGGTRVVDRDTGAEVPADGQSLGELLLRGNTVMRGYLDNPVATAEAFAGGWYHTGDLAVRHPDGYIEIKDRAKDIIISGGENISSLELEEALYRHPAVYEAAVVAKPDPTWGETPVAYVTPRPDVALPSEAEMIAWLRGQIAGFKLPRTIVAVADLPKTSTGKIQKTVLRERARQIPPRRDG